MIEFLYLLIILGSLQGVINGLLLWLPSDNSYAGRLLAIIIWITALPGFHLYLHYKVLFAAQGPTAMLHAVVPWVIVTALGPLILFYSRAVRDPLFRINPKHAVWFLPVIIDLLPKLAELAQLAHFLPTSDAEIASFTDVYNRYADIPRWLVMAICIIIAHRELRHYRSTIASASDRHASLRWLSQFLGVFRFFLLLWLAFLIPYVLPVSELMLQAVGWFPVYIPMAAMIYWLGIRGYLNARASPSSGMSAAKRKTAIDAPEMTRIIDQLTTLMQEQKLYLNPELNLAAVSRTSNIAARSISFSLNQYLGKTFNQYLNEFRVEEFKRRAALLQELSIAGLAADCGFPSLPTFQRAFKQITGKSPTEYLKEMIA